MSKARGSAGQPREREHAESGFVMPGFGFFDCPEFSPEFSVAFLKGLGHRIIYFSEKR